MQTQTSPSKSPPPPPIVTTCLDTPEPDFPLFNVPEDRTRISPFWQGLILGLPIGFLLYLTIHFLTNSVGS